MNVAGSAHRLFERRLHHARLRALVPDAVRRVSMLDGLERAGVRGLVARGWAQLGAGPVPPHVHLVDDIPHDWLFPHCAAVCHDEPARATHRRDPLGHVAWDVSGSPSLVKRLERALASPLATQEHAEPEPEHASQTTHGVVLRDADSAATKLHSRPAAVVMDNPTRARILENYESATRRTRASASRPAG